MNIAYFPGCSLHAMAREFDISTRLTCKHLGVTLQEVTDWNCCGATAAHSLDHYLTTGLNTRNLALVKKMQLTKVTSPCAGCYSRLKMASHDLRKNPRLAAEMERLMEAPPPVDIQVQHLLQLILEEVGVEGIEKNVIKPLQGLKLAAYYGCLITRPFKITGFDDPEQPITLDLLLQALGADTVNWSHKAECCGGGFAASQTEIVVDLSGEILEAARQAGAEAIVVACPMCQANLDTRQPAISTDRGVNYDLPIIYFTQLMGLAFGYSPSQVGLKRLLTSPLPLLRSKGLV
ncbi:CoB--CoM heterodisulfide reductase iron-sulfur subunit B family protein [Syntrophomonas erecta]